MAVVETGVGARTMDFEAGDVGYVQQTIPHYIENTGDEDLRFLRCSRPAATKTCPFSKWLSRAPLELAMGHLNIDKAMYDAIPKEKAVVVTRWWGRFITPRAKGARDALAG